MFAKALLVAACLSVAAPALAASPFAGVWRGGWSDAGNRQSGTASLSIGDDGTVRSGTVTNSLGLSSPLTGVVADDGEADLSYTYGGRGGGITYRGKGHLAIAGSRLSGVLDFYLPNNVVFGHGAFALDRAKDTGDRAGVSWAGNAALSAGLAIRGGR